MTWRQPRHQLEGSVMATNATIRILGAAYGNPSPMKMTRKPGEFEAVE
jgi:hypothetical protein